MIRSSSIALTLRVSTKRWGCRSGYRVSGFGCQENHIVFRYIRPRMLMPVWWKMVNSHIVSAVAGSFDALRLLRMTIHL
jgi:hypothetical protein